MPYLECIAWPSGIDVPALDNRESTRGAQRDELVARGRKNIASEANLVVIELQQLVGLLNVCATTGGSSLRGQISNGRGVARRDDLASRRSYHGLFLSGAVLRLATA
jgi:hypothetical protein